MFSDFNIEDSFFYIDERQLDEFKLVMEKYKKYHDLLQVETIKEDDGWILAFYIWLLLIPDNQYIIENVKVSMYYRNFNHILNELVKNSHFLNIKNNKKHTEEFLFITTLVLTTCVNKWCSKILKKYNLQSIIENTYKSTTSVFKNHTNLADEKTFMEEYASLIKSYMWEIKNTNEFHELIKNNCMKAQLIYEKNAASSTKNEP